MKVANDLGYGSVKAVINNEEIHFPTVLTVEREQDLPSPVVFDSDQEKAVYFDNFLDKMDVTIASESVSMQGRFLIGYRAVTSKLPVRSYDINDYTGKADSDLSMIFTLSMIAGQRVKQAVENNEDIFKPLAEHVTMTTALPVKEGQNKKIKDAYRERFMGSKHQVTFHNFKNPITVTIQFDRVLVATEGETAQLSIANCNDELAKDIRADFDKNYPEFKKISLNYVVGAKNAISLDIGAGTVDIVVIIDGKANVVASASLSEGYDNALEEALDVLISKGYNFGSRAELKSFLSEQPNPLNKQRHKAVTQIVYDQLEPFGDRIVTEVSKSLRKAGSDVDIVFVHGGGAVPMGKQSSLREKLSSKLMDYNGGQVVPVVWIGSKFAQNLNRDGLKLIVDSVKGE